MKLVGKVALVAGSGRGTGRIIALEMANAGADVITCSRTRDEAEGVAEEIRLLGRNSVAISTDLSITSQVKELVNKSIIEMGKIDILIYNAGLQPGHSLLELTEEDWDQMLGTNLKGYFICAQAVANHMVKQQIKGKIVAISSIAGLSGFPDNADYCAAKGGMIALTKEMGIELAKYGITANVIAPGFIWGDLMEQGEKQLGSEIIEQWKERVPLKKFAKAEDIAKTALFLASNDSDYLTGTVITVDGGLTLGSLPMSD